MSELISIDHTEPNWSARYSRGGRENGAATYSRDIVRHYIPAIKRVIDKHNLKVVVSTAPAFNLMDQSHLPEQADIAIQFLHTYDYKKPLLRAKESLQASRQFSQQTIFVTSYRPLYLELIQRKFKAIFLPMAIDTQKVTEVSKGISHVHTKRPRAIYFGNITSAKQKTWHALRKEFKKNGWILDRIDSGKFNGGEKLSQEQSWKLIAKYSYGVGVGRCALEMMAMGLKVMIAGPEFGGLITSENDLKLQREVNMNGRVITFNRDISTCVRLFDQAIRVEDNIIDVSSSVKLLEKTIGAYVTITTRI